MPPLIYSLEAFLSFIAEPHVLLLHVLRGKHDLTEKTLSLCIDTLACFTRRRRFRFAHSTLSTVPLTYCRHRNLDARCIAERLAVLQVTPLDARGSARLVSRVSASAVPRKASRQVRPGTSSSASRAGIVRVTSQPLSHERRVSGPVTSDGRDGLSRMAGG